LRQLINKVASLLGIPH